MNAYALIVLKIAATAFLIAAFISRSKDVGKPRGPVTVNDIVVLVCFDMLWIGWIWWPK